MELAESGVEVKPSLAHFGTVIDSQPVTLTGMRLNCTWLPLAAAVDCVDNRMLSPAVSFFQRQNDPLES